MSVFLLSLKECRTESKHYTNTDIYRLFASKVLSVILVGGIYAFDKYIKNGR